jgi:hypothetical protein
MRTRSSLFVVGIMVTGTIGALTPPASAAQHDLRTSTVSLDGATLARAARHGGNAGERGRAVDSYVRDQMRSGRLVDGADVRSAVVDGVSVVWDSPVTVDKVDVETASDGSSAGPVAEGLGTQGWVADEPDVLDGVSRGVGLTAVAGVRGGSRTSGYCVTTRSSTGNSLTSCYEKYRLTYATSTRDFYYYNRWATATGTTANLVNWTTTRIDIRSRPWSGQANQVATLNDYWPRAGQNLCTASGSLGYSFQGFSASVPIQDCEDITPTPDATAKSMTVIYDQGAVFSGRSHGTEFGLTYATFKGKNPAYADYNYAKYCRGTYLNCDGVLRKDNGW